MSHMTLTLIIFFVTYICIVTEAVNKMTIALFGGFLIVLTRVISQEQAWLAIDWNVIFLLIGMMIIMSVFKETGVFQYLAIKTVKVAKGSPMRIMLMMFVITAIISAFLDNVTTVMIIIPINILIAHELGISAVPFVVMQALASNIGGTATLIGDPPNILIGSATELTFLDFIFNLAPIIIIIMIISIICIYLMFHKRMRVSNERRARVMELDDSKLIRDKTLLRRSLIVMGLLIIGFVIQEFIGLDSATVAMTAALALLIMSNRREVEHIMSRDIDWVTLFFFMGLFIIVEGMKEVGILRIVAHFILGVTNHNLKLTSLFTVWFSGGVSALIGNIPYVAVTIPMFQEMSHGFGTASIHPLWWALSLGACLGANATILGAAANVISVGIAKKSGLNISFFTFFYYSILITFLSLVIATLYIYLRYFVLHF